MFKASSFILMLQLLTYTIFPKFLSSYYYFFQFFEAVSIYWLTVISLVHKTDDVSYSESHLFAAKQSNRRPVCWSVSATRMKDPAYLSA